MLLGRGISVAAGMVGKPMQRIDLWPLISEINHDPCLGWVCLT